MRISFRLDQLDTHAHFAVFVNGGKAGDLCLRGYEYRELVALLYNNSRHSSTFRFDEAVPTKLGEIPF